MSEKERINQIIKTLEKLYPEDLCSLQYRIPHELLISVRLAAQCTDARVNIVTKTLFQQYPTLESFAAADLEELEQARKEIDKTNGIKPMKQNMFKAI